MEYNKHKPNFEEAWNIIQEEAINKIIGSFEEERPQRQLFTSEQYMRIYSIVYTISVYYDWGTSVAEGAQSLYDNCKKTLQDYTSAKVLPLLRGKTNEILLQDLVTQWNNQKRLSLWLSHLFNSLERYFIPRKNLQSFEGLSYLIFYEVVYGELNDQILGSLLSMIRKEREGMKIDQTLVKNVLDIYVEMGEGSTKYFEKHFEGPMLDDTEAFYSSQASYWIPVLSHDNFMLKIDECLNQEKDRINAYLSNISHKDKLLDLVRKELNIDERDRHREQADFFDSVLQD